MSNETYLGDGLYVSHDGYQFCLRAPREDGDHVVYLEPGVVGAFRQYVDNFYARVKAAENCDCGELAVNVHRALDSQSRSPTPERWQSHVDEARAALDAFRAALQRLRR